MNRIINIIGIIVLCGILVKLSYVFIFLFAKLDDGSWVSAIIGVTFAFASVWFVVKIPSRWLKLTMVALDVCIILYYYLHSRLNVPIEYSAIIVAAYNGLIVYFLGSALSTQIDSESASIRLREIENRQRIDSELREIESEIVRTKQRFRQCKPGETKEKHWKRLEELEIKHEELLKSKKI